MPTAWASSPGPCSRVSSPATIARPANVPPWKWGTSPLAILSSVDLPEPEAPATTTSCAGRDLEADVVAAPAPPPPG